MKNQSGFTLIELMIVVAIMGILAATAVASYNSRVIASQVTRVYYETSNYTRAVEERLMQGNYDGISTTPDVTLGYRDSDISTLTFGTFTTPAQSIITAEIDGNAYGGIHGTTLTLTRADNGTWSCTIAGSGAGWKDAFKPTTCS